MRYYNSIRTQGKGISYIPGEPAKVRHARRLEFNLAAQDWVAEEAQKLGLNLAVKNSGHHWQFRAEGFCADWWPSTAKLVFSQRWRNGIHVHDHITAMDIIRKKFKEP